ARSAGVLRDEGCLDPAGEGARGGPCGAGHSSQHDLAGCDRDPADAAALEGHGRRAQEHGPQAPARPPGPAGGDRARRGLPGERRVSVHDGHRSAHRRRLHGRMIVDIHAHYFPQSYMDLLVRIGGRSLPEAARPLTARPGPPRRDDASAIATRLQQMQEAEVQLQVLSPAASPPYAEKEADAVAAARLINDTYAELAQKHPGKFNAVVAL